MSSSRRAAALRLPGVLTAITASRVLAVAMGASGLYVVALGSRLSFLLDDWQYILHRRGLDVDVFLRPASEHLVAAPVAMWKVMLPIVGMDSTLPFRVVCTAVFLLAAGLFFVWARRRIGEWPALLATIPLLFLGSAFEDLLWISSVTFFGATAGGLGMLLALERRDRSGDRLACAALVASMLFSSLWLAFAAGAVVDIALRRQERPWRSRVYVVAVPAVLFVLWWLGWGHEAESSLSFANLAATPRFVFDSIAAAIAALLGLAIPVAGVTAPNGLDWGRPLAVLFVALAAWRIHRFERVPRSLWVVLAVAFCFWALAGLDVKSGRGATSSRYQFPGAVLLLLIAVELLRGVRLSWKLMPVALVVVGAASLSNSVFLHQAYQSFLGTSQIERADLAALEIARGRVDPAFFLDEPLAGTPYLHLGAGSYFAARDDYGSPAYSEAELAGSPAPARTAADRVLVAALGIELRPAPAAVAGDGCSRLEPGPGGRWLELPTGRVTIRSAGAGPVSIGLRRFAAGFPVALGTLSSRAWYSLAIPTDRSERAWQMKPAGSGAVTVCTGIRPQGR